MCGIVAYIGKNSIPFNNMKLMAMAIDGRGKDGIGVFVNGSVFKKSEAYKNGGPITYFTTHSFSFQKARSPVIIHNRAGTRGGNTTENLHPFVYEKDGVNHYFVHNGTLTNEWDLCKKYGVNYADFRTDTHLLGHLIVNFGFDVLKDYIGAAAIVYYRSDMSNTIFVFKGASRSEHDGEIVEERPLWSYKKGDNEIYFASLRISFDITFGTPNDCKDVVSVPENTVFQFTDGVMVNSIPIDRSHINPEKKNTNYFLRLFKRWW